MGSAAVVECMEAREDTQWRQHGLKPALHGLEAALLLPTGEWSGQKKEEEEESAEGGVGVGEGSRGSEGRGGGGLGGVRSCYYTDRGMASVGASTVSLVLVTLLPTTTPPSTKAALPALRRRPTDRSLATWTPLRVAASGSAGTASTRDATLDLRAWRTTKATRAMPATPAPAASRALVVETALDW